MFLRTLRLLKFRNYEETCLEFNSAINIIAGPNAQGKTNIIEAIYVLMLGRSFRAHQNRDLIKYGNTHFAIEGHFVKYGVDQKLQVYFDHKERKILHNSTPLVSITNLVGILPGVISTPDDIRLVKGNPQLRRQWIDIQLAQADPLYVHHLSRYGRAVKQRNHLLKAQQTATIESWEKEISLSAAYITLQRQRLVTELQPYCQKIYHDLSEEQESFTIQYKSCCKEGSLSFEERREFHLQQLQKNRPRELQLGFTLNGPHKDELSINIGEKEASDFASEGQQRCCVTALRFAEWYRLKLAGSISPVMMIDDIGLSLDAKRRQKLIDQLKGLGQVFVTTTESNLL